MPLTRMIFRKATITFSDGFNLFFKQTQSLAFRSMTPLSWVVFNAKNPHSFSSFDSTIAVTGNNSTQSGHFSFKKCANRLLMIEKGAEVLKTSSCWAFRHFAVANCISIGQSNFPSRLPSHSVACRIWLSRSDAPTISPRHDLARLPNT